ncbi:TRAP transporter large permease subunit [Aminipila butyrica]|uniref:TRAP transporter large permease subunit n=1 Tax=Aminipila butyrica TaxID=433296 RepID=A0A858BST0_9FIRM|nr:gluconate:H+ symporter [Aminipila butyrica]QIB68963.1 TRAP transporter large permease subunit [Aminipila butyrica]
MPIIVLALGIILLFALIILVKLNGFLSLMIAALFVGFFQKMPAMDIITSIETGLGGTLGHVGLIVVVGAIFGKVLSEGGGAQRIAMTLINSFGSKRVDWAICLTSFILGIILFFEVSFVLLIPIVFTVAVEAKVKLLKVGIPCLAALAVTHCFLPPHPGPVAIAGVLGANIGIVLAYGLIIAIPATIIFGPFFARFYRNWDPEIPHQLVSKTEFEEKDLPGFGISVFTALSPVILILCGVIGSFLLPEGSLLRTALNFIGNGDIALLIALFLAFYVFGLRGKRKTIPELMKISEQAMMSMGAILFVLGGGGAFKQVILDSGMADYIAAMTSGWHIEPLLLAWVIAAIIRLAVGSATVTVLTTSAIILPVMTAAGTNPELMVLAIGCGSIFGGPPSDVTFWFCKEYFNLTIGQTVKLWSVQATLLAIYGLAGVMILNLFL